MSEEEESHVKIAQIIKQKEEERIDEHRHEGEKSLDSKIIKLTEKNSL